VVFTQAEALVLVMTVLDGQPASGAGDDLVGSALDKLIRALPDSVGREAATLREHASATPDRRPTRPDPATTSALVAAVAARRAVLLGYRSESGREWQAEVDPWAVVVRHGRWYLLCHSHLADATRTYRVDRIRSVQQTERACRPPSGLDPVTALEANLGSGWEYATRVVFDAPVAEVAPWVSPPMGRLEPLGDGCVLVGTTSNPAMYSQEWLARVPLGFRVEGGPELRAAVEALAARLVAALPSRP
jgi:predicted DNA-binding transcriptional regulator YafY